MVYNMIEETICPRFPAETWSRRRSASVTGFFHRSTHLLRKRGFGGDPLWKQKKKETSKTEKEGLVLMANETICSGCGKLNAMDAARVAADYRPPCPSDDIASSRGRNQGTEDEVGLYWIPPPPPPHRTENEVKLGKNGSFFLNFLLHLRSADGRRIYWGSHFFFL